MLSAETSTSQLQELKNRLLEINNLTSAASLLHWDQATYMPPGGAAARGRQIATLQEIAHQKFTSPQIGELLAQLSSEQPDNHVDSSLIRVTKKDYDRAIQIPAELMARIYQHQAESYVVWGKARPENDFKAVEPYLQKNLALSQELASLFPNQEHIADPLIAEADYGMKATTVRSLFAELRQQLVPMVEAIASQPIPDVNCLHQHFPENQQLDFTLQVIKQIGYDFQKGRQDKTLHPFMTKFSLGDVRITTRVRGNDLSEALFSTIHETGHALYEQGINPEFEGTPLAHGTSAGVHESQSRLWENLVGRSHNFWEYFYPQLQEVFPEQLGNIALETFYQAINKVERSLIRTDADEVTYNLHVMIRFELELQMLEGKLAIQDLPEAWNTAYQNDLGVTPQNDSEGVLQDVHWFVGSIGGMFQGYTLGNIMSAQFYQAALKAHPEISQHIQQGQFSTLHNWLKTNIYQYGSQYTAAEVVERATGSPLTIEPFINYLRSKYALLYPSAF
ncbi:carboxypeptidase M32 [Merismopedia glauca]|uniref:Metal-dependent carboxypeptidase n=1 Tax=Merismopedia glauca CCAP 1448/3 TaxID=1296344 RepID=A0A2T1BZH6_9CYAN|nr:carboxypeptidase M32 [Merismopedia glauca]PSB01273.1 carboxypeptidase [Merismopedia glauca CCAP 1448/3]